MNSNDTEINLHSVIISANTGLDAIKRAPIVNRNTGIKCLRIQDVSQKKDFNNWGFTEVSESNFLSFQLKENDILIARTGGSIGVNLFIDKCFQSVFNNGLIRLRVNEKLHSSKFVYYLLQTEDYRQHINSIAFSTSAQPNMKIRDLLNFRFLYLHKNIQVNIARILTTLDDRITLLRETNATLEAIAQALFKSWFVDFDPVRAKAEGREPEGMPTEVAELFPSEFEESELGEIPKGWQVGSIYEISDLIYGAPFASSLFNSNRLGIPLVRIRDLKDEDPVIFTPENHPKGYLIKPGDIVVGMDGEFRAYLWGGVSSWLNQRVCIFKPKANVSSAFLRNSLIPCLAYIEATETATTVIHLGKNDIDRFKIILPPKAILDVFTELTASNYQKIVNNKQTARTLTELRDTLLPRLMSGKLRIPDLEEQAA